MAESAAPLPELVCRVLGMDRRAHPRHRVSDDIETNVQVAEGETCRIRVLDISHSGLAFQTDRRVEPGTILSVELPSKDRWGTMRLVMRVMNAETSTDGSWKIGCSFTRHLTQFELLALL